MMNGTGGYQIEQHNVLNQCARKSVSIATEAIESNEHIASKSQELLTKII